MKKCFKDWSQSTGTVTISTQCRSKWVCLETLTMDIRYFIYIAPQPHAVYEYPVQSITPFKGFIQGGLFRHDY